MHFLETKFDSSLRGQLLDGAAWRARRVTYRGEVITFY